MTGLVNGCYEQKQEIKKVLDNSKQKVIRLINLTALTSNLFLLHKLYFQKTPSGIKNVHPENNKTIEEVKVCDEGTQYHEGEEVTYL